jgi:hypothetical protein
MAELSRDVQDRHAIGQQQRRERVTHLARPAPIEAGCIQDAVERFAYVRPVERRARDRREDPLGNGCPNASQSARCRAPSRLQSLCAGSDGPGRGGEWSRLWTWRHCTPRSVS